MSEESLCVISFAREAEGVFTNGTLSTLDGTPRVSWTFHQDDGQFTLTTEVDEDDFDAIWNGLTNPVFTRHAVRDLNDELDFRTHYIIGIVFDIRGEAGQTAFAIPAAERDPDWLKWLKRIEATQRPAS